MLVGSISHDLKTTVTSIKCYVEGILDGVAASPQKVEKYLKTISLKATKLRPTPATRNTWKQSGGPVTASEFRYGLWGQA